MQYPKLVFNDTFKRSIAYLLDLLMIRLIRNTLLALLPIAISGDFISPYQMTKMAIYLAYFTLSVGLTGGYTIGKAIMGLKVVPLKTEKLDWSTVLIRELVMGFVHYKWRWLFIIVPFNEYNQTLADMLSDTGVINERYLEDLEEYVEENIEETTENLNNYQIHVDNL